MATVVVSLLLRNSARHLEACAAGLNEQSFPNLDVCIIDSDSSDNSVALAERLLPKAKLIRRDTNVGYAAGHNQAIRTSRSDYLLALNPDVRLMPDYVSRLVEAIESDPQVGMAQGKLLNARLLDGVLQPENTIDSAGLWVSKTRRNGDRGIGEPDAGQYDQAQDIFGAAGAAPFYRRKMLEDIRLGDEYFDETFFLYREEVDLAWRAQWRGWRCRYVPTAVAYHTRSYSPRTRREQPTWLRQLQYRNRYLMLVKNDSMQNMLWHLPYLIATEVAALAYLLLAERELLPCYVDVLRHLPQMLRKRRTIMAARRVSSREIRRWFH
jgi:GT2 family glycosyltransferase